jgi:hypothetical protein
LFVGWIPGRSHAVWQSPLRLLSDKARGGFLDEFPGRPALTFIFGSLCRDGVLDAGIYRSAIHRPLALELIRQGEHDMRPCGEQCASFRAAVIDERLGCFRRADQARIGDGLALVVEGKPRLTRQEQAFSLGPADQFGDPVVGMQEGIGGALAALAARRHQAGDLRT